jgi:hypothetical protein
MPLVNAIREKLGTYKQSSRAIVPSGRIWPNGEFSLGYSRVGDEVEQDNEWSWTGGESGLSPSELDERLECLHGWLEAVTGVYSESGRLATVLLTLSSAPYSDKLTPAPQRGLKGLTGYGTKMLRSGCFLLEQKLGREDCVMITLTVPTLGQDARRKLALRWGVVTNNLVRYLTRKLVSAGRPAAIAGCVEIQTGRLEQYRQGYLHIHLVCPAYSNTGGRWAIDASALRTWWANEIERTIQCTLPNLPRVETAIVQKSVEGYLGKYLSKGTGDELAAFIGDLGEDAVPAQWWFMSAPLKRAIRENTASGRNAGAILDALVNYLLDQGTGEGFEYIRHIDCELGGKPVTVGYIGRLSTELRQEVFGFLDNGQEER